ncbi:MAG: DUF2063 domain-containing protein [Thiobacillaceae bacterium]
MNGQEQFLRALLDPEQPCPAGLTAWNGSDPAARFAIYRNNVVASLIDALAETHPVTQELVGREFFRAMARLFVNLDLPRSRILAFYGESFPAYIEQFPPATSVPYLADMARLEMARVHAYHARDADVISTKTITHVLATPGALPNLMIGLHPSASLLRSRYAVGSLWSAHQGIGDLGTVNPNVPENLLIVRSGLQVSVIILNGSAAEFIGQLLQGVPFGVATQHATENHSDFDLAETLALLIHQGAITSMTRANAP